MSINFNDKYWKTAISEEKQRLRKKYEIKGFEASSPVYDPYNALAPISYNTESNLPAPTTEKQRWEESVEPEIPLQPEPETPSIEDQLKSDNLSTDEQSELK